VYRIDSMLDNVDELNERAVVPPLKSYSILSFRWTRRIQIMPKCSTSLDFCESGKLLCSLSTLALG